MYLQKDKKVISQLDKIDTLQVIHIQLESHKFYKRFKGYSFFFRSVKNGLYSLGGQSNRSFFKDLSGVYFTLESNGIVEILIVYDTSIRILNQLQLMTRLKKLLGLSVKIEIGGYNDYRSKILEILHIKRDVQPFGDFYFKLPTISNQFNTDNVIS
jgi:hypothetical protein